MRLTPVDWVEDANGCWIWQRGVDKHGYGKLKGGGRALKAHRVAYERVYGAGSLDGLQVHHECGVKLCVNPDHLLALTPKEHGDLHGQFARLAWEQARAA